MFPATAVFAVLVAATVTVTVAADAVIGFFPGKMSAETMTALRRVVKVMYFLVAILK